MRKLIMTRGLPGSGKTFWATEQQRKKLDIRIVCKDDIRNELEATGWKWSRENEKQVLEIRDNLITKHLTAGWDVISADTNFGRHKNRLFELAKQCGAEFEVKDFTKVPLEVCIERDAKREKPVGAEVIKQMYNQYVALPDVAAYTPTPNTPWALICDLDGTLALHDGKRSPYDYAKCGGDRVNKQIATLLKTYLGMGYHIIYCSGREDSCRNQTEDWLVSNELPLGGIHKLLMRKAGDHRKDCIVKQEIFDTEIRNNYNVQFVLDDRNQVVQMWRRLGLQCWQVADGDF